MYLATRGIVVSVTIHTVEMDFKDERKNVHGRRLGTSC